MDAEAQIFRKERGSKHGAVIKAAMAILHSRFAQAATADGYRKDGPVGVAKFELGKGIEPGQREAMATPGERCHQSSAWPNWLIKARI